MTFGKKGDEWSERRHENPRDVVLSYLSSVLESEWCLLVLRRAARWPLMGTVLIRSKCTRLLLRPGGVRRAAGVRGGQWEEKEKKEKEKRRR